MRDTVRHTSISDSRDVMLRENVIMSGKAVKADPRVALLTEAGFDGTGILIAVLDSGVDGGHPQLVGRVVGDIEDLLGHGTFIATEAAGSAITPAAAAGWPNLDGSPIVRGVAPGARILSVRILDKDGSGSAQRLANGIRKAVDLGADVICIAAGQTSCSPNRFNCVVLDAVRYASRNYVIIGAATGNSGGVGTIACPARHSETVAVGSVNLKGQVSGFASKGLGNRHADIFFYGGDGEPRRREWIYSGTGRGSRFDMIWPDTGEGFAARRGTSMSVGFWGGYTAQLLHAFKNPQEVMDILKGRKDVRL